MLCEIKLPESSELRIQCKFEVCAPPQQIAKIQPKLYATLASASTRQGYQLGEYRTNLAPVCDRQCMLRHDSFQDGGPGDSKQRQGPSQASAGFARCACGRKLQTCFESRGRWILASYFCAASTPWQVVKKSCSSMHMSVTDRFESGTTFPQMGALASAGQAIVESSFGWISTICWGAQTLDAP